MFNSMVGDRCTHGMFCLFVCLSLAWQKSKAARSQKQSYCLFANQSIFDKLHLYFSNTTL